MDIASAAICLEALTIVLYSKIRNATAIYP
jgi:hypothetical protein